MRSRLDMDRDEIGAGLGEGGEKGIAWRDHEMHVEEEICVCGRNAATTPGRS